MPGRYVVCLCLVLAVFFFWHCGGATLLVDARLSSSGQLVFGGVPGIPAVRVPLDR
jgi:hypothetical protein